MRLLHIILSCLVSFAGAADFPWTSGQKMVITGDSITDATKYSHYLIAYLHLRHPDLDLDVYSFGRGGTTPNHWIQTGTTTDENYAKVVAPIGADYVSIMHGMNGSYTSDQWETRMRTFCAEIVADGGAPVLIGPQPQSNSGGRALMGGPTYGTADGYSNRLLEIATEFTYPYSDTYGSLFTTFTTSGNWTAIQAPGTQSTPETHPGTAGHIMMAYTIINNLGWGTDVSAATINGSAATLTSSTDCTIASITTNAYGGIDFTRLDDRLPWAIDEAGRASAVSMIPAMSGWQSYMLTVTGLTAGTYDVYIDGGVVASVTHTALGSGWNMADLTTGPVWDKCQETLGCIRDQQGVDRTSLATKSPNSGFYYYFSNCKVQYTTNGLRDAALVTALASPLAYIDGKSALVQAAAQPETLSFSLHRQGYAPSAATPRTSTRRRAASATP